MVLSSRKRLRQRGLKSDVALRFQQHLLQRYSLIIKCEIHFPKLDQIHFHAHCFPLNLKGLQDFSQVRNKKKKNPLIYQCEPQCDHLNSLQRHWQQLSCLSSCIQHFPQSPPVLEVLGNNTILFLERIYSFNRHLLSTQHKLDTGLAAAISR